LNVLFRVKMKILVIRFKYIGDTVLTSAIFPCIKEYFPEAKVDYLVYEPSACLFENQTNIDSVIPVTKNHRKNPFAYLKLLLELSKQKYDVVIDATASGKSELVSLFCRSAKYRIGREKPKRGFFYTHKRQTIRPYPDKIFQRLDMLKPLLSNQGSLDCSKFPTSLKLNTKERQHGQTRLLASGRDTNKPLFVFSVSARQAIKKWPTEYMLELVNHCIENLGGQILLYAGAEHERKDIEHFRLSMKNKGAVLDYIETKDVRDLATLLVNCDMFVGNDCGPLHIANALGVPSVAIFSPLSEKKVWMPRVGKLIQGIEWQDAIDNKELLNTSYEIGDDNYYKLYNNIKPKDVIPLVDDVFQQISDSRTTT